MMRVIAWVPRVTVVLLLALASSAWSEDSPATESQSESKPAKVLAPDPPGAKRLLPDVDAWIDAKNKRVIVDGVVCLRAGVLEMFACLKGTKEHESVVSVDCPAHPIHAALVALGAKPGSPVQYRPEFKPANGTTVEIRVLWKDEKGVDHQEKAQTWVRQLRTKKQLDNQWVFGGSRFFEIEEGQEVYEAEGGDFICVSNFPSAMLDLPIESSQATSDLLFEAFTEHIPARGTKVRLVLTPQLEKK